MGMGSRYVAEQGDVIHSTCRHCNTCGATAMEPSDKMLAVPVEKTRARYAGRGFSDAEIEAAWSTGWLPREPGAGPH